MNADARVLHARRQRRARFPNQIHVDAISGECERVILHPWTSTEIAKYNHRCLHRELSEEPNIDVLRVALVVGDTAGHTHPALAVADAMSAQAGGADILFLGTADSVAASIVQQAGHAFAPVPGSAIRNANLLGLARAAHYSLQAIAVTRQTLRAHRTQLAMGFGGFASGGVLLAARTLGLPTAILEANVELGLANRWLRPWMRRVFQGLGAPHPSVTGVPVRPSIVALRDRAPQPPHQTLRILVVSGSRGADFFAACLPPVFHRLMAEGIRVEVWQQCAAPQPLREQYVALSIDATVDAFISDTAAAYAWADVAITRGGANTIAELAIAGLPALLVPLADASANHQAANAALWQRTGAGLALSEREWREDAVTAWLHTMATETAARSAATHAARRLAHPDAAIHIADACAQLIRAAS